MSLQQALLAALPQTQCTRCGYPDCAAYAQAIAHEQAPINQCPPGGAEGVARLAHITGQPASPLNPVHGQETPRAVAWIDESWCIGCTLCIKACPTDAIVGTHKRMHTVIEHCCTGCALCLPVCPVDCIHLENVSGLATGWQAWSAEQALQAQQRYAARQQRLQCEALAHAERQEAKAQAKLDDLQAHTRLDEAPDVAQEAARKRAIIQAALERARSKRGA